MSRVLVLSDEANWPKLFNNGKVLNAFPFLKPVKTAYAAAGTGCCPNVKKANTEKAQKAVQNSMKLLGTMAAEDKEKLKQLLNASHVRIFYKDNKNGTAYVQRVDF